MKKTYTIDLILLFAFLSLCAIGILSIYSSIFFNESMLADAFHTKQFFWVVSGIVVCIVLASFPPQLYYKLAYFSYGLIVFILFFLTVRGEGVARWISIGWFSFQPSEFAKVAVILCLAKFLSTKTLSTLDFKQFLRNSFLALLIVAVPGWLILTQPNLGTSLIFLGLFPFFLFWRGVTLFELFLFFSPFLSMILSLISLFSYQMWLPWLIYFILLSLITIYIYIPKRPKLKIIGYAVIVSNIIMGIVTPQVWTALKPYQQNRIISFVNPSSDPFGAGYQVIQSRIAISSGGFWGKGWLEGSQTKLNYIPEQHTDFIFSSFSEQFGFVGSIFVLFLFFVIVYRLIMSTVKERNSFVSLCKIGFASYIVLHVFINIGVTVGIMPVTGLPLILLSYGGSITISSFILLGITLSAQIYSDDDIEN